MCRRWLVSISGIVAIVAVVVVAQQSLLADTSQTYCFNTGANATGFSFCLSGNGTITRLRSPFRVGSTEHIRVGAITEGYAVCDLGPTADGISYDYGSVASTAGPHTVAFGPTTVVTGCVGGELPCTMRRDTANDKFRLKMTFDRNTLDKELTITTTVTNLTSVAANDLVLMRFADADMNGTVEDVGDASWATAWARDSEFGVFDQRLGLTALTRSNSESGEYSHWTALQGYSPPIGYLDCVNNNIAALPYQGDVGLLVGYDIPTIAPLKSKTYKFQYRVD